MKNTAKKIMASVATLALTASIALTSIAGASAATVKAKAAKTFKLSLGQLEKRAKIFYTTTEPGVGAAKLSIKAKSASSKKAVVKIYQVINGKKALAETYTVKKSNGVGKDAHGDKVDLGNPNPYALTSGTYIDTDGTKYGYMTINNLTNKAWFWNAARGTHTTAKFTFKNHMYTFDFGDKLIYRARVKEIEGGKAVLQFTDALEGPTTFTLVSNLTDKFSLYSDSQLKKLAVKYYKAQGNTGEVKAAVKNAPHGSVKITLTKTVKGQKSVCAVYTVNRITGSGHDSNKTKVALYTVDK